MKIRHVHYRAAGDEPVQPRRLHLARKDYLRLGGEYAPPKPKPTKGERAAARRQQQERQASWPLTPRPDSRCGWWTRLRAKVLAVGRCAWCGSRERLTVDHITPLSAGGTNGRANLQCLCSPCNRAKGSLTGLSSCRS